ncbi:ethanolamine kinase, partial [Lecanoromycetidae sp. Uapishka_2]
MSSDDITATTSKHLRHIPLSYNNADSQTSALRLILTLYPDWEHDDGKIEFVRFTDGITNTLLKAVKRRPGCTDEQIDEGAVLLRAYGKGTEVLIDREKEATSHSLLSQHGLAPSLLARFQNGLIYRFIRGRDAGPEIPLYSSVPKSLPSLETINAITPGKPTPNVWTIMQKWAFALPTDNKAQVIRKDVLQKELERTVSDLGDLPGLGGNGLVFGHTDLLSGNVIVQPRTTIDRDSKVETVCFIDYEYAVPSPAAFDIANHFAEWGGFTCDFSVLPTRSMRQGFVEEYIQSYASHSHLKTNDTMASRLFDEIDAFRGVPGLYWGIWALIQATISQIDFDYAAYAEVRLGEYWAWRAEEDGSRAKDGKEKPLRERRWAEE